MNIIAVDDEAYALSALQKAIREALPNETPVCFATAADALEYAGRTTVDVAFLDVEMESDRNGIDLARALTGLCPTTNIVFVTGYLDYLKDAFDLYASGYVSKPVRAKRIAREMAHLRHPVHGEAQPEALRELGPYTMDSTALRVYRGGADTLLTPKEYHLMDLLANRIGEFIPSEELYQRVWGNAPNNDVRTVYKHIYKLRGKLRMSKHSVYDIETKRNAGYRLLCRENPCPAAGCGQPDSP